MNSFSLKSLISQNIFIIALFASLSVFIQCTGSAESEGDASENDIPAEYADLSVCDCHKALMDEHDIATYEDFKSWGIDNDLWPSSGRGMNNWDYGVGGIYPTSMRQCSGFMRLMNDRGELYSKLDECPLYRGMTDGKSTSRNERSEDLIGMYIGTFSTGNMINVTIEHAEKGQLSGRSVCAGNHRPLDGTYKYLGDNVYEIVLDEPGDDKYDGQFEAEIDLNSNRMKGSWTPYKSSATKSATYNNKKVTYRYNPNVGQWPEGSNRILNKDVLWEQWLDGIYDKEDFILMSNEIFARRGYSFGVRWIRNHFEKQAWYLPIDDDVYSDLNATERKNVKTLNDFVDEIEQLEEQQEAIQYRWGNGY
ncbi:MAG: YARHG domain-containing protein [Chitinophagales bacterium]